MKKKLWIILFLLFVLAYVKPVYADDNFTVCSQGCDYQTLDAAFQTIAADNNQTADYYSIEIFDEGEYQLTQKYSFHDYVTIYFRTSNVEWSINGNNTVIETPLDFWIDTESDVTIKNLELNYLGEFGALDEYVNTFLAIYSHADKVKLSDVTITSSKTFSKDKYYPQGLHVESPQAEFNSIYIANFKLGLYASVDNLTFDNCYLLDNYYSFGSVSGNFDSSSISVKNTSVSRAVIYQKTISISSEKFFEPIKYVDDDYFNNLCSTSSDDDCGYQDYAYYIGRNQERSVTYERVQEINFNNQKGVDDILSLFQLNSYLDNEEYVITSSDPTVAKIDGKKITFLKAGTSTITITNEDTHEEFKVQFKVEAPTTNPKTGRHILSIILGILFLGGITLVCFRKRIV